MLCLFCVALIARCGLSAPAADPDAGLRADYARIKSPEITLQQYLKIRHQAQQIRQNLLTIRPRALYVPVIGTKTPCGNGDFETGLNPAQWQGADGTDPASGTPVPSTFTEEILGGALDDGNAHQTVVDAGATDTNVGIRLTAPTVPPFLPSNHAIRIGNDVSGAGAELLSKTFTVTQASSLISFWYAVVLEDPGHLPFQQPKFWCRVTDKATGNEIPGVVDLGNGTSLLISDRTNPFFQVAEGGSIVYKDWTCSQINLSGQIGKTVTIEFISEDCTLGGHFGYAYVDNFCGSCAGSAAGSLTFAPQTSSSCGVGKLCFNYTLPKNPTTGEPGTVKIALEIFQAGKLVTTLNSPLLTSGTSFCFPIPANIHGIKTTLGAFDFVAKAQFTLGGFILASQSVGAEPEGLTPGVNNDYKLVCSGAISGDKRRWKTGTWHITPPNIGPGWIH